MRQIYLGLDPAIKNFGFSVIELHPVKAKWRLLDCGLLKHPMSEIGHDFRASIQHFHMEMSALSLSVTPQLVAVERFMNRGMVGASQTEKVNLMIGYLAHLFGEQGSRIRLLSAGAWKAKVNAKMNLDGVVNQGRAQLRKSLRAAGMSANEYQPWVAMVPHCTDATVLAAMMAYEELGMKDWIRPIQTGEVADKVSTKLLDKALRRWQLQDNVKPDKAPKKRKKRMKK